MNIEHDDYFSSDFEGLAFNLHEIRIKLNDSDYFNARPQVLEPPNKPLTVYTLQNFQVCYTVIQDVLGIRITHWNVCLSFLVEMSSTFLLINNRYKFMSTEWVRWKWSRMGEKLRKFILAQKWFKLEGDETMLHISLKFG